jgi:hypothetical protein
MENNGKDETNNYCIYGNVTMKPLYSYHLSIKTFLKDECTWENQEVLEKFQKTSLLRFDPERCFPHGTQAKKKKKKSTIHCFFIN